MSWLYSIIFAGLMFSSNGDLPKLNSCHNADTLEENVVKSEETERFEQSYPLNANGRVNVSNVNGSVTVEAWDRAEVKLEYVKTADRKEDLAQVEVRIDARQDAFSVETDYGDWKRRSSGDRGNYGKLQIEYRLMVPRSAVLDEIQTVNGSVSIANAGNSTKASSVNGQVKAVNLRGTASLSTVNGTVVADFDQLQTGGKISLETVNGTVDLMIPSDANATIKADTVNGQISNDFGLPVRKGEYVGRDLYGKIGSGDVQIRLNSVNGALSVKHKNDGRSLSPATNLLSPKNKSDEDWDDNDENTSGVKPPKPPKVPKPPAPPVPPVYNDQSLDSETRRAIEQAMKDAEREMGTIPPEVERVYLEQLKKLKVDINTKEMQEQLAKAREKYRDAMARMAEINWTVGSPNIENKSESFSVKGTPKVTVEAKNCAVTVRGWDKQEVQYSVTRFSKIRNQTPLNLTATQNGSDVIIKSVNDTANQNSDVYNELNRIRIEVFVPKKSNLKITTTGEIRLEGVSGTIDLSGADGAINVRDGDGFLTVKGTDARIRIIGFRGEVESRTLDGSIFLEGDFQRLLAETSNGTIVLDLPENANANFTSNQEINFEGINSSKKGERLWRVGSGGANYFLQSADGEIFVRSANSISTK